MLYDQQTYKVISWSSENLRNYGSPNLAENVNFSEILNLCLKIIFTPTTDFKYENFYVAYDTFPFILKIFGTF